MSQFDRVAKDWDSNVMRQERATAVASQLRRQIHIRAGMRALEFGCGTGLLGFMLAPDFDSLVLADTSAGMLEQVQAKIEHGGFKGVSALLLDEQQTTFPGKFDCIFSLMTLHHVVDYESVLRRLAAHLNRNGFLCVADLDLEDGSFHESNQTQHHGIARKRVVEILDSCTLTNLSESTPYVVKKERDSGMKEYPVFLITAQSE